MAHSIRAVVFDFDGTLVDSEYLHHEAWLEAAAPWGVTIGWDDYKRRLIGISDRRAAAYFLAEAGLPVTAEASEAGRQRKHRAYRSRSVAELEVHPQVRDWIHANHLHVPLGVVSSSAVPDVIPILERQGVARCMQFVICGDHVSRLKPDPMSYQLALKKLKRGAGVAAPEECLVFEDSDTGVRAATLAGMTVHRVHHPGELPDALNSWSERIKGAAKPSLAAL